MSIKTMRLQHKVLIQKAKLVPNYGLQAFISRKIKKIIGLILVDTMILLIVIPGYIEILKPRTVFIENASANIEDNSLSVPRNIPSPVKARDVVQDTSGGDSLKAETQVSSSHVIGTIKTLKEVGERTGVDWKLLYAVCKVESGCKIPDCKNTLGHCDNYQSLGYFQINTVAHPNITKADAENLEVSATWTAQHGINYKDNPAMFCKNHNGINKTTNQWYVDNCMNEYKAI